MAFLEERSDGAAVAIVQEDLGADEVGALIAAAGVGAVTVDALGGIDFAATVGGFGIDHVLVGGPG